MSETSRATPRPATALFWKMGFEIELMAPRGHTRADLAERVARRHGGQVRRFFHPQSEPSAVPGHPTFENLTQGFEAVDAAGRRIAAFVDDLTLQHDFDKRAPPRPGWHRIVADDGRLLRLVVRHCDPDAELSKVLDPLAALFGTLAEDHPSGMVRIFDDRGVSIAIGAPLPGERERPCEIVTAPVEANHRGVLTGLLDDARRSRFTIPREGATHIHFDAAPLKSAAVIAFLVDVFWMFGDDLKRLVGANANCVRLGRWPESLPALVRSHAFRSLDWPDAREALSELELTKYCDFNIVNIVSENSEKPTFEVRILPVWLEVEPILEVSMLFERLLVWICNSAQSSDAPPATLSKLIEILPLPRQVARNWIARAEALNP